MAPLPPNADIFYKINVIGLSSTSGNKFENVEIWTRRHINQNEYFFPRTDRCGCFGIPITTENANETSNNNTKCRHNMSESIDILIRYSYVRDGATRVAKSIFYLSEFHRMIRCLIAINIYAGCWPRQCTETADVIHFFIGWQRNGEIRKEDRRAQYQPYLPAAKTHNYYRIQSIIKCIRRCWKREAHEKSKMDR